MKKVTLIFTIVIIYVFLIKLLFSFFLADIYFTYSRNLFDEKKFEESLKVATLAVQLNHYEPSYYRQLARAYLGVSEYGKVLDHLQQAQNLNENNLTTLRNAIPIYYALSKSNALYLDTTKSYFVYLKSRYPQDLGVLVDVAAYEKSLGFDESYDDTLLMIKNLRPDLLEWYPSLQ